MSARDRATKADEIRVIRNAEETGVVDLTKEGGSAPTGVGAGSPRKGGLLGNYYRFNGLALVVIDVLCLAVALLAAHALRFGSPQPGQGDLAAIVTAGVMWVVVFQVFGLYAPQHLSGLEEFRRTISAVAIGIVLVILVTFWLDVYLSRSWIALTLIIACVLEVTARRIVRNHEQHLRRREMLVVRTLVMGSGDSSGASTEALDIQGSGYVPIGFVNLSGPVIAPDAPTTELVARLRTVFRQYRPDCVLVASPTIGTKQMVAITQAARQEGILVQIYTHLSGIWASRLTVQDVGKQGVILNLKPARLSRSQRFVKRGIDLCLGGVGLLLASPILLMAAIAIKLTSRGPVFFHQDRVTEGARVFQMHKLRTMVVDPDAGIEQDGVDRSAAFFKLKGDPRLTRVGKWLRKTSIDELPQLFNVLVGDMSLVGPRPLPSEQVAANIELLGPRHEVRAGITGWWQIHGRADLNPVEAVRMDHFYIENWSPALDLYVLLRTAGALFTRKGAY